MRASTIWAIAQDEWRASRRLARSWLALLAAVALMLYYFWNLMIDHALISSVSASIGAFGPRYLSGSWSALTLLLLQFGIVLLSLDIRARDRRDRIAEVIDSKSQTNVELLTGRLAGCVLAIIVPFAVVTFLIWAASNLLYFFKFPYGDAIDAYSALAFLTFDLPPSLLFWGSVTISLVLLTRIRSIAALLVIVACICFFLFTTIYTSNLLHPAISPVTSASIFPSDLAPNFTSGWIVGQRVSMIFIALGLLFVSASLYPRKDGTSGVARSFSAASCLVAGIGLQSGLVLHSLSDHDEFERLASVHEAFSTAPRADVLHIEGELHIDPGDELTASYEISFLPPDPANQDIFFAFNPGLEISSLAMDEEPIEFEFRDGLIRIALRDPVSDRERRLSLSANGRPDLDFGYFDSLLDSQLTTGYRGQSFVRLGLNNAVFHSNYVALMPAIKWYPTSRTAYGESKFEQFARDHFTIDLNITVPGEWLVAGPGTRHSISSSGENVFRFSTNTSIPELALFASRFERRSTEIAGVEFELFMDSKHMRNISFFEEALPVLKQRVGEMLNRATELGIPYPYERFAVVEIPNSLRTYGGGWRMDSLYVQPGIWLIRETGFPTARFDLAFEATLEQQDDDGEGSEALFEILDVYFENDSTGGNPYITATRNLMNYQTHPSGEGATALAYLIDTLTARVVTERMGFYSIHESLDRFSRYAPLAYTRGTGIGGSPTQRHAYWERNSVANSPQVWEGMLEETLANLDYENDSKRALYMLILKGEIFADWLIDYLKNDDLGRLLSELRNRSQGRSYELADLLETLRDLEIEIGADVEGWLLKSDLPGFRLYEPKVVRLRDTELGEPEYQTTFYLTNEEPAAGQVKISFLERGQDDPFLERAEPTPPLRIEGNSYFQVALHTEYPISKLRIDPYLSLNRGGFETEVDEPDSWDPQRTTRLPLISRVDWRPNQRRAIVIDDLDEGFSVSSVLNEESDYGSYFAFLAPILGYPDVQTHYDEGLPTLSTVLYGESVWLRFAVDTSFGKYRQTTVTSWSFAGTGAAHFYVRLPEAGRWRLDYYWPFRDTDAPGGQFSARQGSFLTHAFFMTSRGITGSYSINVSCGEQDIPVEFDTSIATSGWNSVGEFLLEEREVEVSVILSEGDDVMVDAVRWTPLESRNQSDDN